MEIQRLGHRAFPSVKGRDLDRLLKGRFFKALLPRWQCKLGAPKMEETFQELYDRARMYEQREKQYAESAAVHNGGENSRHGDKSVKQPRGDRGQKKPPPSASLVTVFLRGHPLLEYVSAARTQGTFLMIASSEAGSRKLQDRLRQPAHLRGQQHWGRSAGPRRFPHQSWRRCLLRDDCKRSSSQSLVLPLPML